MLRQKRMFRFGRSRGFTLMEAAMVTVIIGVGTLSMLRLLAAGTAVNAENTQTTTAMNLANNLHEATLRMTFDQIMALNNHDYSPAVDATMTPITSMDTWAQHIDVQKVDVDCLTLPVSNTQNEPTARVTVTVRHNGESIFVAKWIVAAAK